MGGMVTHPLRVCTFESRRRDEMSRLIERSGALPFNAPSMREIPLSDNTAAYNFAEQLLDGRVPIVVFMTGVGTETLFAALAERQLQESVREALGRCLIVARGPKPVAALSKMKIKVDLKAPEPNTWEDVARELERNSVVLQGQRVAVQEYGEPSREFYEWLQQQGAEVLPVPVYQWAMPEDQQPLEKAVAHTINGELDVLLWTSAQQVIHVLQVAERLGQRDDWLAAASRCVVGSIGPTASQRLRSVGLTPDLEPSHPKMAHLVREVLEQAPQILAQRQ